MEMHLHDPRTIGRLSSRKSSLRRSINSGSSEIGGSCSSVSFSFSLPGGVGLQENGKSMQKKGFMNWFSSKNEGDVEDGQLKHRKNVLVLRLASLNKPETPVFILGSISAVVHGVTYPIFSLLLPSVIAGFYKLPHKLRNDARFWALTYVVLQATCLLMGPTQLYCFAVAGVRLAWPIRSLTFNKIVLYSPWLDIRYIILVIIQTPNLCNRCKIINRCCDSA